ncbi:MAG TPA: hypothetical protein VEQ15_00400 [Myxococcales bacterium]|nr:hypothetical protein [Myxococcales bacterium]
MTVPKRCASCGGRIDIGPGWWRCATHPGHPSGSALPARTFGECFGPPGEPWAGLHATLSRGNRGTHSRRPYTTS